MADIELVIKIDEEDYETLININDSRLPSIIARKHLYNALANGTPLPKGHGRLIDASALLMDFAFAYNKSAGECVHDAPTIIDKDKESRDRTSTYSKALSTIYK